MRKLLLIGGGGHCWSVIDSIRSGKVYDQLGIVDYAEASKPGVPVIGIDEDLPKLFHDGWTEAFITVGSVGNTNTRRRLHKLVKQIGFSLPIIIDPSSILAREIKVDEGVYIGKKAIVNTGVSLGCCSIINTGAIVEHDCKVGAFSHISPGAVLCGQVTVGEDSHIGAGTIIRQQIKVGDHVMIGIGSSVVKNIPNSVTAYGNPCRVVLKP